MDERKRLVEEILGFDERLQRKSLADSSNPLLNVDLTIQQLKALLVLSFEGSASGHELSQALGIHLATATGLVDRLVGQGMAHRAEDPDDRRVRRVYATEAGREVIERIYKAGLEQKRMVLGRMSLDTLRKIREVSEQIELVADEMLTEESGEQSEQASSQQGAMFESGQ